MQGWLDTMNDHVQTLRARLDQYFDIVNSILEKLDKGFDLSLDTRLVNLPSGELNRFTTALNEVFLIEQELKEGISKALALTSSRDEFDALLKPRAIKRSELSKILTELISHHDKQLGSESLRRSVWISPSGHTACIREENMTSSYERPVQSNEDYHRIYYLEFRRKILFKHVDYVWSNLNRENPYETIFIDEDCFKEITTGLLSSENEIGNQIEDQIYTQRKQKPDQPKHKPPCRLEIKLGKDDLRNYAEVSNIDEAATENLFVLQELQQIIQSQLSKSVYIENESLILIGEDALEIKIPLNVIQSYEKNYFALRNTVTTLLNNLKTTDVSNHDQINDEKPTHERSTEG